MDTGGHREAKGQEGEVSFHGCKDVMVSISLTMVGFVWMQPVVDFCWMKNVKAFGLKREGVCR